MFAEVVPTVITVLMIGGLGLFIAYGVKKWIGAIIRGIRTK